MSRPDARQTTVVISQHDFTEYSYFQQYTAPTSTILANLVIPIGKLLDQDTPVIENSSICGVSLGDGGFAMVV